MRPLFIALSLSFVITSLGTTQGALLLRAMDFRSLELRRIAATFVGAGVGIGLALKGFGAWAIVSQQLTVASVETVLVWHFSPWRPSLTYSVASLRSLAGFSGSVFGQNFLYYIVRNMDNVLIGRYLGAAALGAYALAYNVMLAPFNQIAGPLQQVLFPAFSRMQDDRERLADAWIRVTRLVAAIAMPALIGLVIVAPDFVAVVLGERWDAATPIIRILAWVGLIQSLQHLNGDVLYALDRAGTFLRFTIVWAIASLCAFVIGLQWGIVGVAACYAIYQHARRAAERVSDLSGPRDLPLEVRARSLRRGAGHRSHGSGGPGDSRASHRHGSDAGRTARTGRPRRVGGLCSRLRLAVIPGGSRGCGRPAAPPPRVGRSSGAHAAAEGGFADNTRSKTAASSPVRCG